MEGSVLQVKMDSHINQPVNEYVSHLLRNKFLSLHIVWVWRELFFTLTKKEADLGLRVH